MNSFPKFCVVVLLLINIWIVEAGRVNLRSSNARATGYHSTRRIQRNHNIHQGILRRLRRHMKDVRHNPSHQSNAFDGKVTRERRTLEESESSDINRCNILLEKQQVQKASIRTKLSNCNGLLIGPDPNGTQCTSDFALFSYSFPSTLGLITEYDLFVHVPSNNRVNILNHMICAITSEITCGTFTQEELLSGITEDDTVCYSRNITETHQGHNKVQISVDFSCGPARNCPTLWLDGVPLLNVVHRTQSRCNIC